MKSTKTLKIKKNYSYLFFTFFVLFASNIFHSPTAFAQLSTLPHLQGVIPNATIEDILAMDPIEAYLFLDQNYNVRSRLKDEEKAKENLMKPKEKETVNLFLYSVDKRKVKSLESNFENAVNPRFQPVQQTILIPVLEQDRRHFESLTGQTTPIKTVKAKKLLGRKSYLILPGQGMPLVTVKVLDYVPRIEQKAYRSVLNNDYIKNNENELPTQFQKSLLEETGTYQISGQLNVPYTFILRDMSHLQENSQDVRVLPGHGLLGCDVCIEALSAAKGLKSIDWKKKVLIPKIAEITAWFNMALGISPESHTQNLLFKVNFHTGDIEKIFIRDLSDVLIDPLVLLSKEKFQIDPRWDLLDYNSIHRNEFADWTVPEAKDMWYNISIYTGQAIDSHIQGFKARRNLTYIFLTEYIKTAEKILKQPIVLNPEASKIMQSLQTAESYEGLYTGELADRGRFRNVLAGVLKSIYEQYEIILMQKIENNSKGVEQEFFAGKQMLEAIGKGQIRYTSESAKAIILPFYEKALEKAESLSNTIAPIYKSAKETKDKTQAVLTQARNNATSWYQNNLQQSMQDIRKVFATRILKYIPQLNSNSDLSLNFDLKDAKDGNISNNEESNTTSVADDKLYRSPKSPNIDGVNSENSVNAGSNNKKNKNIGFRKDSINASLNSFVLKHITKLTFGISTKKFLFRQSPSGTLVQDKETGQTLAVLFVKDATLAKSNLELSQSLSQSQKSQGQILSCQNIYGY